MNSEITKRQLWFGELTTEMTKLGLDKNTIVVLMGDNGHFTKYSPGSGFTPMIFRGGKGYTTEGAVDAFLVKKSTPMK